MSIAVCEEDEAVAAVTHWLDLTGREQMWIEPEAAADRAWVRFARCGPWHDDHPDPEIFFPVVADHPDTYRARLYCADCPVRRYCADYGATGAAGMHGGILRDDSGHPVKLCNEIGCLCYRAPNNRYCSTHRDAHQRARIAEKSRKARARKAAQAVAA
jgi:hypothetical protein